MEWWVACAVVGCLRNGGLLVGWWVACGMTSLCNLVVNSRLIRKFLVSLICCNVSSCFNCCWWGTASILFVLSWAGKFRAVIGFHDFITGSSTGEDMDVVEMNFNLSTFLPFSANIQSNFEMVIAGKLASTITFSRRCNVIVVLGRLCVDDLSRVYSRAGSIGAG